MVLTYGMMTPRMEELLERTGSRFALVTLSAMRAGEINDYYNQLGQGLGTIVPPQVMSASRKPLSIAMEEIEIGKIEAVPLPAETELSAEPQVASAVPGIADAPGGGRREKRELWKVRAAPRSRPPRKEIERRERADDAERS